MPRLVRLLRARWAEIAVVVGVFAAVPVALVGQSWLLALLLVVSALGEPFLPEQEEGDALERILRIGQLGASVRLLVRFLAVIVLGLRDAAEPGAATVVVVAAGVFLVLHAVTLVAVFRVDTRRKLDVETRNIDLSSLDVPPPPSRFWADGASPMITTAALVLLVPACFVDDPALLLVLFAGAALFVLGVAARAVVVDRRTKGRFEPGDVLALVDRFVDDLRPEVVLYYSDTYAAVYQVNMWLAVVEQLDRPAVVVLRSRTALAALAPTSLPVICAPAAVSMLALDLDDARVSLFVANNGPNIHLLRLPHVRSAFVGHGDSDKNASVNPYAKVYDELWTAGPAGRDRWAAADVGVDLDDVVEVGRPQLDFLASTTEAHGGLAEGTDRVPTVLYAPTWEGWNDTQEYGSVAFQGVALVEAVLASPSPLRLIYKPHPLTGHRDPEVLKAHRRIVRLVREANRVNGLTQSAVYEAPDVDPLREVVDPTERAVRSGEPLHQVSAVDAEARTRAAGRAYLARLDPRAHLVVEGPGPELFTYFEVADFLVTDVSSVLSDFQATGRPFATCNTTGLDEEAFVAIAPASAGGIVVPRDGTGLDHVVAVAAGTAPDDLRDRRASLRGRLLGESDLTAQERFARAVDDLARRADERRG
ncbi:CDP-glycerol glycerophosphotransferase family protein [Solicola sp. PLA-1-18]|uniref:CDP-glycerol glycerophosphotransferase family protein n=1 Tax=Solicola sp. PLA-1-18 TaxID=3380532 RepID=UPI003B81C9EC